MKKVSTVDQNQKVVRFVGKLETGIYELDGMLGRRIYVRYTSDEAITAYMNEYLEEKNRRKLERILHKQRWKDMRTAMESE